MYEVREISRALRDEADALARYILPGGKHQFGDREWKCPAELSPTGGAISVHVGYGPKQGICGFWNDAKPGGDMLDLIERVFNLSKAEAVEWGKDWLGIKDLPVREHIGTRNRQKPKHNINDDEKRVNAAKRIWDNADRISGVGTTYFERRGIGKYEYDELRFSRGLSHPEGGVFPAIVAKVSDSSGAFTGISRIYLKADGSGKAPVNSPKLGLGVVRGGAVRLGGIWPAIGIAEGVETALACGEIVGQVIPNFPVWAALSTSGIRGFEVPDGVEGVRIYPDADAAKFGRDGRIIPSPGLEAARELQKKLCEKGITVRIEPPPVGQDWLDVLNSTKDSK